jgi:hypothetical protein
MAPHDTGQHSLHHLPLLLLLGVVLLLRLMDLLLRVRAAALAAADHLPRPLLLNLRHWQRQHHYLLTV